jgi:GT2 family glycosyltransferase
VAVASPALADPDGSGQRAPVHQLPSASLILAQMFRLHKLLPTRTRGRIFQGPYWPGGDTTDAGWVHGTAMIARRSAVEQVGLLDDSFFLYGEDIDWCWRMRRAGWRIGYCAGTVVRHEGSASSLREYGGEETLRRIAQTDLEAVRRHRGRFRAWVYAWSMRMSLTLEALHPRRSPDTRAWNRAWRQAWRDAAAGKRWIRSDG